MNMLKRFAALALVFTLIACALPFSAGALTYSNGDFYLEINASAGYASVVQYKGNGTTVEIPSTFNGYPVTTIDDETFYDCSNLTSITIPKSVTTIGDYAFQNCTALETISIPSSVTSMGRNAFYGCTSLNYVEFNASVSAIPNNTFYNCTSLAELNIASTVTAIGNSAFYNCSALTTVPTGAVESFGQRAFYNSGIVSLIVSERVATLPYYSFANCSSLEKVVFFGTDTVIDATAFSNSPNLTFYCKSGSDAEQFATDNSFTVETITSILGDADGSGLISISDVTAIQKHRAKVSVLDDIKLLYADVNGDGDVTIRDATTIQMYIAKYIDKI